MIEDNAYSQMQRTYYNAEAKRWAPHAPNAIVGHWDGHNDWQEYNRLWDGLETKGTIALDWATGPGRNIIKWRNKFRQIDGVDFFGLIEAAKIYLKDKEIELPNLYVTDGYDLQTPDYVPSEMYDFVFSTIAFQHIAVYEIRFNYLEEFYRVLKPGGWVTKQMGFGVFPPDSEDGRSEYETVGYYDNAYDAPATNGVMDTRCESPDQIKDDLEKIGFINFEHTITDAAWPGAQGAHPNWIFFKAQKP
jgi:SAM-dependent methyltransferase